VENSLKRLRRRATDFIVVCGFPADYLEPALVAGSAILTAEVQGTQGPDEAAA